MTSLEILEALRDNRPFTWLRPSYKFGKQKGKS